MRKLKLNRGPTGSSAWRCLMFMYWSHCKQLRCEEQHRRVNWSGAR